MFNSVEDENGDTEDGRREKQFYLNEFVNREREKIKTNVSTENGLFYT